MIIGIALLMASGCVPKTLPFLQGHGIPGFPLNQPMPSRLDSMSGFPARDTIIKYDETEIHGIVLSTPGGLIIAEEDFLQMGTVNRIQSYSITVSTYKGITCGMTWGQVRKKIRRVEWHTIFSYGVIQVYSPVLKGARLIFARPDTPIQPENPSPVTELTDDLVLRLVAIF